MQLTEIIARADALKKSAPGAIEYSDMMLETTGNLIMWLALHVKTLEAQLAQISRGSNKA